MLGWSHEGKIDGSNVHENDAADGKGQLANVIFLYLNVSSKLIELLRAGVFRGGGQPLKSKKKGDP